jgi:hypothetical protein
LLGKNKLKDETGLIALNGRNVNEQKVKQLIEEWKGSKNINVLDWMFDKNMTVAERELFIKIALRKL